MTTDLPLTSPEAVRQALRAREEIALIDVREEHPFALAHPLFAAQLPLSRLEADAPWRLPRRDVRIVVMDDGDEGSAASTGLALRAALRLTVLGYTRVSLLDGGLAGWRRSGGEVFRDVNVPSKAFGELVEHERHTPSLSADEVKALLDARADVVVLDARRYDEYQTMSLPQGISVPGAELLLRLHSLAPDPATRVIVHCAGRTRSLIGAQSLINAGVPNPVVALRNGTIGWTLAGHALERGQSRRAGLAADNGSPAPPTAPESAERTTLEATLEAAPETTRRAAQRLADRAGAHRLTADDLHHLDAPGRTVYRYDVRSPQEYAAGHLPGFGSAPGGQLVQETDVYAPVRGARIVLADDDGVRAPMTAHWLAQMGWDVAWLADVPARAFSDLSPWPPAVIAEEPGPACAPITADELAAALRDAQQPDGIVLIDVSPSAAYVRRHLAGAWWALRSGLEAALALITQRVGAPQRIVVTAEASELAAFAAADLALLALSGSGGSPADCRVAWLVGGNAAGFAAGLAPACGEARLTAPRWDRYRRPYEGTDNPREAMQGYLDWEYGLVAQLARDGTHGFKVLS